MTTSTVAFAPLLHFYEVESNREARERQSNRKMTMLLLSFAVHVSVFSLLLCLSLPVASSFFQSNFHSLLFRHASRSLHPFSLSHPSHDFSALTDKKFTARSFRFVRFLLVYLFGSMAVALSLLGFRLDCWHFDWNVIRENKMSRYDRWDGCASQAITQSQRAFTVISMSKWRIWYARKWPDHRADWNHGNSRISPPPTKWFPSMRLWIWTSSASIGFLNSNAVHFYSHDGEWCAVLFCSPPTLYHLMNETTAQLRGSRSFIYCCSKLWPIFFVQRAREMWETGGRRKEGEGEQ